MARQSFADYLATKDESFHDRLVAIGRYVREAVKIRKSEEKK